MRRIAAALLFVLFLACPSFAQEGNAALTGFIQDSSKAVIPDVRVLAINTDTNQHFEAATNKDGSYNIASLPVGPYRMQIEKPGFRTILKEGIFLHTQDVLQVNFQMAVGSTDETITVSGDSVNINTTDASVSTVIDRQFAENLPLNGRSFQSLIYLTPGVTLNSGAGAGPNSEWSTGQFSVNGQRPNSNYWTVDGVSANIGITSWNGAGGGGAGGLGAFNALGGTNSLVSVDAMQEFRVQTSTYAPEFGRVPGGQISIITRSGTNRFHGTLFDYFRNTVLDANDWFNGYTNDPPLPKAAEQQNDFGGVLGGPIIKDKTFFFFSYEGLRLNQPQTLLLTVPDLAARQNALPTVQPFINAFPLPTGADACPATSPGCGFAPFNVSFSSPSSIDAYSIRIDHALTKSVNLFGRYNQSPSQITSRGQAGVSANTTQAITSNAKTATIGATWTKSSDVVNETRFNYSTAGGRVYYSMDTLGGGTVGPGATLLPDGYTTQDSEYVFAILSGTNMHWAEGVNSRNTQHQYNVVDTLSVERGTHALKFGVDYRRLSPFEDPYGYYSMSSLFLTVPSLQSSTSYATYLQQFDPPTFLFNNLGVFGQDTWRVNPRLTVTYGLRWDIDFRPSTESGPSIPAVTGFSLTDLSSLALAPAGTPVYSTQFGGFAPRVGAAYQISRRPDWGSVFRGGFGVFYDLASTEMGNNNIFDYPFGAFAFNLNTPFPPTSAQAAPPAIVPPNAQQGTLAAFDPHLNQPYTLQWSAALEQAFGASQTFTASYVGSAGRRLLATADITAPNQNYAAAMLVGNAGSSNYNALQLQFQRRLSRGLQALASYTWSHAIDTGSSGSYSNGSFADINSNRGPSDFDIRHAFSAALTYDVPTVEKGLLAKAVLGGWSTENILQIRSASPVSVIDGAFTALTSSNSSIVVRPDLVSGQPLYLYGSQYPGRKALNPDAFTNPPTVLVDGTPAPTRQGDLGRNALQAFGLTQWDFAVHRDFPIRETVRLQFRAEMFNVLNHPNFAPYNNTFGTGDPHFGLSTELLSGYSASAAGVTGGGGLSSQYALGGPRSGQLALKLSF